MQEAKGWQESKKPFLIRLATIVAVILCAALLILGISGLSDLDRAAEPGGNDTAAVIQKNAKVGEIENNGKVHVYVFWGSTCPHCEELWEYLESLEKEYGDKFTAYGFEVWRNDDNQAIKDKFAEKLGDDKQIGKDTVPYMVIGDTTYLGFGEGKKQEVLDKILETYQNLDKVDQHLELVAPVL